MAYSYKSFQEVVNTFESACNAHLAINTFHFGTIDKLDASSQNVEYPYIFLRPLSSPGLQNNIRTLAFEMYSLSVPYQTDTDVSQVMSDTEQYIYDIVSYFRDGANQQTEWIDLINITPVNEAFNDRTFGWVATINYKEEGVYNYCEFPQI